jgi:histidinol phosphatase-like enzyme
LVSSYYGDKKESQENVTTTKIFQNIKKRLLMNKALFTNFENTIILNKGQTWKFLDRMVDKVGYYVSNGYIPIIVSNQPGVELGHTSEVAVLERFENVVDELKDLTGADNIPIYYSTSLSNSDFFRKPNPGMAYQAAIEHHLNLKASLMIGSTHTDEMFAAASGVPFYYTSQILF